MESDKPKNPRQCITLQNSKGHSTQTLSFFFYLPRFGRNCIKRKNKHKKVIKRTTAEQQNQRTLEGHTQTVESASAAWRYAAVQPKTDSVSRVSLVVVVREGGKLDSPAEIAGDGVMPAAVPWALRKQEMQSSSNGAEHGRPVGILNGKGESRTLAREI